LQEEGSSLITTGYRYSQVYREDERMLGEILRDRVEATLSGLGMEGWRREEDPKILPVRSGSGVLASRI